MFDSISRNINLTVPDCRHPFVSFSTMRTILDRLSEQCHMIILCIPRTKVARGHSVIRAMSAQIHTQAIIQ